MVGACRRERYAWIYWRMHGARRGHCSLYVELLLLWWLILNLIALLIVIPVIFFISSFCYVKSVPTTLYFIISSRQILETNLKLQWFLNEWGATAYFIKIQGKIGGIYFIFEKNTLGVCLYGFLSKHGRSKSNLVSPYLLLNMPLGKTELIFLGWWWVEQGICCVRGMWEDSTPWQGCIPGLLPCPRKDNIYIHIYICTWLHYYYLSPSNFLFGFV